MITQENRFITIETPLGKDALLLTEFHGEEQISHLFQFDLSFISEDHNIPFKKIIGENVTISIFTPDGEKRYFHGIIAKFAQGRGGGEGEGDSRFSHYTARMVPWFWLLTRTADSRIFQEKSVQEIIQSIFEEHGFQDFSFRLSSNYSKRTYCVQYRESDFNFISRLLEEEGIYYFFEHKENMHNLVIADNPGEHPPCPKQEEASYELAAGSWLDEDVITTLELEQEIRPGKYTLNDYNFEMPATKLKVTATAKTEQNLGPGEREIYDHPGEYGIKADGQKLVDIRMEAEEAQFATIAGTSVCRAFSPGYRFKLANHYRTELNDEEYVLTKLEHTAQQGGYISGETDASYENSFCCMPHKVPFRPVRSTPRPIVEGVQTAIVVGPAGEEIYTDEHGRVKVQFHWDREGKSDDKSSCWIRVSQLWAGAKWGAMYIPRIGHEVIIDFIEGDPDRPIIVGRVYHGDNQPPYSLPAEKTKSTIKSDSTIGGGGSNEFRFEDKKGEEEVFLHGQKDWTIAIENDKNQTVGHDETLSVGNNRSKTIGVDQSEQIGNNKSITVGVNHTEAIGANMQLNVGSNKTETVAINTAETIGVAKELTIGAAYQVSVGAAMNETIGAAKAEEIGAAKSVNVGANSSENVGANKSVDAGKDIAYSSGKKMTFTAGDDFTVKGGKKGLIDIADELTLKCGKASITLKKNGDITIKGKTINIKGSGNIVIKGKKILEN